MTNKSKRGKTLLDLSTSRNEAREKKNKKVFVDGVNQRANIKQDLVIDNIVAAVGDEKVEVTKIDLCKKHLHFNDLTMLDDLKISYYTRNNLFSRIFDFIAEATIDTSENKFTKAVEIGLKYEGILRKKEIVFIPIINNDVSIKLAECLNSLTLLKERVRHLELLDYRVKFDPGPNQWYIGIGTGKGSCVWMLFPPAVLLTPLDQQDAIKLIELFQLTSKALITFEHHIE